MTRDLKLLLRVLFGGRLGPTSPRSLVLSRYGPEPERLESLTSRVLTDEGPDDACPRYTMG